MSRPFNESNTFFNAGDIKNPTSPEKTLFRKPDYQPLGEFFQSDASISKIYYPVVKRFMKEQENPQAGIESLVGRYEKEPERYTLEVQIFAHEFAGIISTWLNGVGVKNAHDLPKGYAYKPRERYNIKTNKFEPISDTCELFLIGKEMERGRMPDIQLSGNITRNSMESFGESPDGMRPARTVAVTENKPDIRSAAQLLKDIKGGLLDELSKYVEERQKVNTVLGGDNEWNRLPGQGDPKGKTVREYHAEELSNRNKKELTAFIHDEEKVKFYGGQRKYKEHIEQEAVWLLTGDWKTWKSWSGNLSPQALQFLKDRCGYSSNQKWGISYERADCPSMHIAELYKAFRGEPEFDNTGKISEEVDSEKKQFLKQREDDFWYFMEHGNPNSVPLEGDAILLLKTEVGELVALKLKANLFDSRGIITEGRFLELSTKWLEAKDILEGKGGYCMPNQTPNFSRAEKNLLEIKDELEKIDRENERDVHVPRVGFSVQSGSMAAAFARMASPVENIEPPKVPEKPREARPIDKPNKPLHPAENQRIMTAEAHRALTEDLALIKSLILNLKSMHIQIASVQMEKVREIEEVLRVEPLDSKDNPSRLLGIITGLRSYIESQYKSLRDGISNKNWLVVYVELWNTSRAKIKMHKLCQEFIGDSLTTEDEVLIKLHKELANKITDLQNGKGVDVDSLIGDVLADIF